MNNNRVNFLISKLEIPSNVSARQYPFYEIDGCGNISSDSLTASMAWKKVSKVVSENILKVIKEDCASREECEALLVAISGLK